MEGEQSAGYGRRTVLQALGLLGTTGLGGITAATPGRKPGPKERELLVGADESAGMERAESEVKRTLPDQAAVTHRNEKLGYMAVELPEQASSRAFEAVKRSLEKRPGVDYVEQNATFETQVAPNDPGFDQQYAPQQVNAPTAWDTTVGSTDVTVAVIDTGADYGHADLSSLYASDPGYDFVARDGDPYPSGGADHGTHVSGCASADTDNGTGVAGISDSTLINARCLSGGSGSLSDIADGIQWAADQGADIINMSLGGGGYTNTMKNAVQYAYDQNDVLVVCAAGNDSRSSVSYPAAYEECVAVSAIDPNEDLASFSNYGSGVEVAAPGVNVYSTVPNDSYASFSGTSMASPVAAGVAALGKAAYPGLSASELRQRLRDSAVDVGLSSQYQGAGRVDAANIVAGGDGGGGGGGDDGGGGGGGGTDPCSTTVNGSATSSLSGWWDSDQWQWPLQLSSTCDVTVTLDGPSRATYVLYVAEGYIPTTSQYDKAIVTEGSPQSVTIDSPSSAVGILVDSYWGSGDYRLSIEETGDSSTATTSDAASTSDRSVIEKVE